MKNIIKNALILTAITLVSGLLLGLVYEITKGPIALSKEKAKQAAYKKVLSEADTFKTYEEWDEKSVSDMIKKANIEGCKVDEVAIATKGDSVVGYVITATSSEGYGGDIQVSVGVLDDGTVNGVAILSISETVGLGMRAADPEFYTQFNGKQVKMFVLTKNGAKADNEIDAISGATITSTAVTNAINASVLCHSSMSIGGSVNE